MAEKRRRWRTTSTVLALVFTFKNKSVVEKESDLLCLLQAISEIRCSPLHLMYGNEGFNILSSYQPWSGDIWPMAITLQGDSSGTYSESTRFF